MKAVITVIGRNRVGILAGISGTCARLNANIKDVSQTILEDMFTMIMLVELKSESEFSPLVQAMRETGEELGVEVRVTRRELYDEMHRI